MRVLSLLLGLIWFAASSAYSSGLTQLDYCGKCPQARTGQIMFMANQPRECSEKNNDNYKENGVEKQFCRIKVTVSYSADKSSCTAALPYCSLCVKQNGGKFLPTLQWQLEGVNDTTEPKEFVFDDRIGVLIFGENFETSKQPFKDAKNKSTEFEWSTGTEKTQTSGLNHEIFVYIKGKGTRCAQIDPIIINTD